MADISNSISCGFFDSKEDATGNGDRRYSATDLSSFFNGLISDGIFSGYEDGFLVTVPSPTAMSVLVKPGKAYFNNRWMINSTDLSIDIATAPATGTRIDTIALVVDESNRSVYLNKYEGGSDGEPASIATSLQPYTHVIAYVSVGASVTTIEATNITDRRGTFEDEESYTYAPYAASILNSIDPTTLVNSLSVNLELSMEREISIARTAGASQGTGYWQPADIHFNGTIDSILTILDSSWTESDDPPYSEYPWYVDIASSLITAGDTPHVYFAYSDYKSGNFCPFADTSSSSLRIYAAEQPNHTSGSMTIDHIVLTKKVEVDEE